MKGLNPFGAMALLVAVMVGEVRGAVVAADEGAIARVRAGREATAKASWWGFDPEDATRSLQAALNSAAKMVVVDRMETPWVIGPIRLPGDKEIVFAEGVVVEAKRGEFRGKSDCLFIARGRKNLVLRGAGAILRMRKADYHRDPYELAEWRHALSLRGCENVTIEGLVLAESGGDGIYLGTGPDHATNRNITIRNVVCDGNNRQGISVITAENLLIENCVFRNTRGTAPQSGIDFEPNHAAERLVNCVLRNCRSENNAGHAYHLYLGQMHRESTPVSIRFENCSSKGCGRFSAYAGLANREGRRCVGGSIDFVGCEFDSDVGGGVHVRGSDADGCAVALRRCKITRSGSSTDGPAPIKIEASRRMSDDVGNVMIEDCLVRDGVKRRPFDLAASPLARVRNIAGDIRCEWPGEAASYQLDEAQLAEWFPGREQIAKVAPLEFDWRTLKPGEEDRHGVREWPLMRLRGRAGMVGWAEAGTIVDLVSRIGKVGRHELASGVMTATLPDGTEEILRPTMRDGLAIYSLTLPRTGPFRIDWVGGSTLTFRPIRCNVPLALSAEGGLALFHSKLTLCFQVPKGRSRFAMLVAGSGTAETVKATIRNATGKVVAKQDNIAAPHVFVPKLNPTTRDETWSITLAPASEGVLEDVEIRCLGIAPLLAPAGVEPQGRP